MLPKKKSLLLFVALLALLCGRAAAANLLADGDFESFIGGVDNPGRKIVYSVFGTASMGAWDVGGISIHLVRGSSYGAIEGVSVDLSGGVAGSIAQEYKYKNRSSYTLTWDYGKRGRGSDLKVTFGGKTSTFTPPAGTGKGSLSWSPSNSGKDTITFSSFGFLEDGATIDNICLAEDGDTACGAKADKLHHLEPVPDSTAASTCLPLPVTLKACANAACTSLVGSYAGTVTLSTSRGVGRWGTGSGPAPAGTLSGNGSSNGAASYTFATADAGQARLTLSHSLSQAFTLAAADAQVAGSSGSSATVTFSDNAFAFSEDLTAKVQGDWVAVAGRPHDLRLTFLRKDANGSCGAAPDYQGSKALKIGRTDTAGSWTAPVLVDSLGSPVAVPLNSAALPKNFTLNFNAGVAEFTLRTSDIGRYSFWVYDDNLVDSSKSVYVNSTVLTVRPFALLLRQIKAGTSANPSGTAATDARFTTAGAPFTATLGAYLWSAAADGLRAGDEGRPSASATEAQLIAGGLAPRFASAVLLSLATGSQTPAEGVLGTLSNGAVPASAFTGGQAALSGLSYSEVGSFRLNTAGVVSDFLGSALSLDLSVVNGAGSQSSAIGRFVPAGFAMSGGSVQHRPLAECKTAASFNYIGEPFRLRFTLNALNAQGDVTRNYTGAFARLALDGSDGAALGLMGIDGSTPLSATAVASGSWKQGISSDAGLLAVLPRGPTPAGPFDQAKFGIVPSDPDGVTLLPSQLNLDTSSPADSSDRALVASVPLRWGRLRLQSAIGSNERPLRLPLLAQYWDGSQFLTNLLDSCTRVSADNVSIGNYTRTLRPANTPAPTGSWTLSQGGSFITLPAPAGDAHGSYDLSITLAAGAGAEDSCLAPWTPGLASTSGAGLSFLKGNWCGAAFDRDPAARASFGLYRGNRLVIYERKNH